MKSKLIFTEKFPNSTTLADHPVLIFDQFLLKNAATKTWIESFPYRLGVQAGEELKQLKPFEKHFISILKLIEKTKTKNITLIALGGGSLGDFAGFMASVFKRGVPLVHIPSTWLAAIDSSHGGKTALNVGGYKNQMGTFYPANKIYLIKSLLLTQPQERVKDAMGEVLKTILLEGGNLWKKTSGLSSFNEDTLWKILPELIKYKYKIVKKDPFETKGIRFFLNFGHTYGHVLESIHNLPHGVAVNYGLRLALELSLKINTLNLKSYQQIQNSSIIQNHLISKQEALRLLRKTPQLEPQLRQDKKANQNSTIRFVLLKDIGKPCVQEIKINTLSELKK